jgi:hypothetical protein
MDEPSSHSVSSISRLQHWISQTNRLTSTGPSHTSKADVRQEIETGKMCFASWGDFTVEFVLMFCPENEATTV